MTRIASIMFCIGAFSPALFLFASDISPAAPIPHIPATVQGTGTHFSITDSAYKNVALDSDVPVRVFFQSVPEKITLHIAQSASSSVVHTHITLSGLDPNTTYHKYTDRYENHEVINTDATGTYSFDQSLESPHLLWIQPRKSTKFILDDEVGGDCTSIGNWDVLTKTCTLGSDVNETIEIGGSGITLDGAGHLIAGAGTGSGVYVGGQQGVIIRNLSISHFSDGIQLFGSQNTEINNITIAAEASGISALETVNTHISESHITAVGDRTEGISILGFSTAPPFRFGANISNSVISGTYIGINVVNQDGGTVRDNTIENSRYLGLNSSRMYNFILRNNVISRGIFVSGTSDIDESNLVSGKPIINLYNQTGGIFDGSLRPIGQFFCTSCSNVTVKNANLSSLAYGAAFIAGNGDTVLSSHLASNTVAIYFNEGGTSRGNTFDRNETGIFFDGADGGLVEGNTFLNQTGRAVFTSQQHLVIHDNSFENNELTFDLRNGPSSKFYNNNVYSGGRMWGKPIADNGLPDGGNYWEGFSAFCPDINFNKICDVPFSHSESDADQFTDNYPWTEPNAWPSAHPAPPANVSPTLSNLGQFKMFGIDPVGEGSTFIGNVIVFKGVATDTDSTSTSIEFEIKPAATAFDGIGIIVSSSTSATSSTKLSITIDPLIPKDALYTSGGNVGSFHWRARAIDSDGNKSAWQEFGSIGNTDFSAKVVPLWTQNSSEYPSIASTTSWATQQFGGGNYTDCIDLGLAPSLRYKSSIRACGCTVTSMVMLSHYYGIENGYDGAPVTPITMNNWLEFNHGYDVNGIDTGDMNWTKAIQYLGYKDGATIKARLALASIDTATNDTDRIFTALSNSIPILGFDHVASTPNNQNSLLVGHYIILDSALNKDMKSRTATVKDPFWFNTKTWNDTDVSKPFVQNYEGDITRAYIFRPLATPLAMATSTLDISMASPAELLITDQLGRREGKDPRNGTVFSEIPDAAYYLEGRINSVDSAIASSSIHDRKVMHIPNPIHGKYVIQVIGTGSGTYTVSYSLNSLEGTSTSESILGTTTPNAVTNYDMIVTTDGKSADIHLSRPELISLFKQTVQTSTLKPLVKLGLNAAMTLIENALAKNKTAIAEALIDDLSTVLKLLIKTKDVPQSIGNQLLGIVSDIKLTI